MKNLVIAAVGDDSCHTYWLNNGTNFDLALIYFGSDIQKAKDYSKVAKFFKQAKGNKFKLIFQFYKDYEKFISENYRYIWMPDDDLIISGSEIDRLFEISEREGLILSQPAIKGYFSHRITKPKFLSYLRYTNFVEVIAPLMEISIFINLSNTFCLNESSWGYEFLWVKMLGNPKDKIGIIDSVIIYHTRPIGNNYSRFSTHPFEELKDLNLRYKLNLNLKNFNRNLITYKTVYKTIFPFKK
jgi:hypothetical protein